MKFHVSQSRDCLFGQRNAVKFYQSFSFRLSTAYLTEAAFSFLFTSFSTRKQWKFLLATIKYSIRYNLLKYQIFLKANTFLLIYLIFNVKYPTPSRRLIGKLIFFFFTFISLKNGLSENLGNHFAYLHSKSHFRSLQLILFSVFIADIYCKSLLIVSIVNLSSS